MKAVINDHIIFDNLYQVRCEAKQKEYSRMKKQQTRIKPEHRKLMYMLCW